MNLSDLIKNGQQLRLPAGSAAIALGDLTMIGGLGNELWPAGTMDYAASAAAATLVSPVSVVAAALPGSARQPVARDRLGNVYTAGTNSGGNLVVYKRGPFGTGVVSAILDATATSVNTAILFQLSNGNYACVYARAAGALYFVVFDSMLTLIAGPVSVATERAATNVVYHHAVPLSSGGLGIIYQTSAGTAINYASYSNAGAVVTAAASVQALTGSAAQMFLQVAQLSSGNLVCAYRGTMIAGGNAGTNVTVFTTAAANVAGPVSVDTASVLGFLELSALASGGFAAALADGTNLVCSVYSNLAVAQGSQFSVANTLNSTTYPQVRLLNDGVRYWLAFFTSAGNGLSVIALSSAGVTSGSASGLGAATFSASTFALDADVVNGLLVVLGASSATAGQFWMTVGLPDASLGVSIPYVRTAPTALGSAAATTGSRWPRVLSSGAGLYKGASPPSNQPTSPDQAGDFTAIFCYDQTNVAATLIAVVKVEASALMGVALAASALGQQGNPLFVNPGQGEYGTNPIAGTSGITFNHLSNALGGTAGTMYANGVALSGIAQGVAGSSSGSNALTGTFADFGGLEADIPAGSLLCYGQLVSRVTFSGLFAKIGIVWGAGDGSTTFQLPDFRGVARFGAENMGGVNKGNLGGNSSTGGIAGTASIGTYGGQKAHVPTLAETAAHSHAVPGQIQAGGNDFGGPTPVYQAALANNGNSGSAGGGTAFNVTNPAACVNVIVWT